MTDQKTDQKTESKAIHPIVEAPYPKVAWEYHHIFGGSDKFDENNNPIDESKWRNFSIHVTPQKRFEAAYKKGLLTDKSRLNVNASRATINSSIVTTIDTRVVFHVKELVYPGDKTINIEQKWLYAFHVNAAKVLAEVFTVSPTKWLFRYNPDFSNASVPLPDKECDGKLELPMIKASEAGSNIGFIISPFRLTSDAVNFLLEDAERLKSACVCAVRESNELYFAAVPDPYQWATDTHEKYYIPLLDEWQEYIFDPQVQARHFIAGTLKAWIEATDDGLIYDSKDPLDIEDELKSRDEVLGMGEPYRFLEQYRIREEELRIKAEKAGAYLYHCVYSAEQRALEMAALEAKDLSLCLTFQNWAVVCDRACETAQGRLFAVRAYKDPERLPQQYLFSDESVPPLTEKLGLNFPNLRYAWGAGISIVGDLSPAVFEYFKTLKAEEATKIIRQQVLTYLKKIGMDFPSSVVNPDQLPKLKRYGKTLYHNLKAIEEGKSQKMVKGVEELYERIQKVAPLPEMDIKKATELELLTDQGLLPAETRLSKLNKWYDDSFLKRNRIKIAFAFESINVVLGFIEYWESDRKMEWNNDKFVSLVGASADFTSALVETALGKVGWDKMIGRVAIGGTIAGAAGILGGICQMSDEQRQMVEGVAQYDFGVGVGHGLAAAGAAMTAIAGGLILAKAVGAGSVVGGPVGAGIGAIGAGLIIGGNLLAAWLKDNQHEQFARFCFLGKQYDTIANQYYELNEKVAEKLPFSEMLGKGKYHRSPIYTEWSAEGGLPTDDILKEARLLMWLLSSFQLALDDESARSPVQGSAGKPVFVKLIPGYLTPAARIEIKLEQVYTYRGSSDEFESFEATLSFDQTTDELVFMHGNMKPFIANKEVKRDEFGNLQFIKFAIRPEQVKFHNKTMNFDDYLNYVCEEDKNPVPALSNTPNLFQHQRYGLGESVNHQRNKGLPRYPVSSIVKARITMGGVFQPSAAKYLQLETLKDDKVSSSSSENWSS